MLHRTDPADSDQRKGTEDGKGQGSSKAEEGWPTKAECVQAFREGRTANPAEEVTQTLALVYCESTPRGIERGAGRRGSTPGIAPALTESGFPQRQTSGAPAGTRDQPRALTGASAGSQRLALLRSTSVIRSQLRSRMGLVPIPRGANDLWTVAAVIQCRGMPHQLDSKLPGGQ